MVDVLLILFYFYLREAYNIFFFLREKKFPTLYFMSNVLKYTYFLFQQLQKFVNKTFDICLASIKPQQNDWLTKSKRFPFGEFIFLLNTDWRRNNLNINQSFL